MSQLALQLSAPARAVDPESPEALAIEIATNLREAEQAIGSVAADLAGSPGAGDLGSAIQSVMDRQLKRAEEDLVELRQLHARILGCSVDELDARMAAEKAQQEAERRAAREARPAPLPRAPKKAGKPQKAEVAREEAAPPTRRLTERQRELLRNFEVRKNVARFSREERIPDWAAVKEVFVALGAKWRTGKPGGFHFPADEDGAEKVRLALETGEIFDPKAAGFFPTPAPLADRVVARASIRPGMRVLEPSAGKGALALAVRRACPETAVLCAELLPDNRVELERLGFQLVGSDFLALDRADVGPVDAVVMNPPFGGRDDIRHIQHAARFLGPGGTLVAIASGGVEFRDDEPARGFRAWVAEQGGRIEKLPEGSFLESGTGVRTCLVTIGGAA